MELLGWLWPISSGVADAGARIAIKKSEVHNFVLSGLGLLCGLPFYAGWLFISGMPEIKPTFWLAVAGHIPLYVLVQIFTVEAHRAGTMVKTMPLSSLTPAMLLITSPIMGGGTPTFLGGLGILITVVGLYAIHIEKDRAHWLDPLKAIVGEKSSQFMFGATLCQAVSANLDKTALLSSNGAFYLLIDHAVVALWLLLLLPIFAAFDKLRTKINGIEQRLTLADVNRDTWNARNQKAFAWYGLFNAGTSMFHIIGLGFLPHVPYFISGKRTGAVLFGIGFGLLMWHLEQTRHVPADQRKFSEETENLGWKLLGTLLVLVGMFLVIFYGKA